MDKCLLVLGASSDVGTAYIKAYHERYDKIVGTYYTNKEPVEKLKEELGGKMEMFCLNMLQEEEIDRFAAFLEERELSPEYVLHLPAQRTEMKKAEELESGKLRDDLELGVVSIMRLMRTILPHMKEKEFGRICFLLSSVTEYSVAYQSSYMITKYALLGAVRALAVECAPKKIMVNAVSPSMIDTKFIENVSPFVKKKVLGTTAVKRLATVDDVIRSLAFLLDEKNEYMTGENLLLNGGGRTSS